MFENHPHFAIFPGERVEIMPVLPIPGHDPEESEPVFGQFMLITPFV